MSWLSINEFSELKKVTPQAVYKWIKEEKVTWRRFEEDNKIYIFHDIREDLPKNITVTNPVEKVDAKNDFKSDTLTLSTEDHALYKKLSDLWVGEREFLKNELKVLLENELKNENKELREKIEQLQSEIAKMKDEEIKRLRESGFLKRLFGG